LGFDGEGSVGADVAVFSCNFDGEEARGGHWDSPELARGGEVSWGG
jgi:hypothetical protein